MPSLLGTYVAANYGRMTSQDTYGGITFSNFGTRNLAFLKVVVSGAYAPDLMASAGTQSVDADSTGSYSDALYTQTSSSQGFQDANSYFSVAVRTIQQFAEVYFVGSPYSTSSLGSNTYQTGNASFSTAFIVAVAIDTANDAGTSVLSSGAGSFAQGNTEILSYPTLSTFDELVVQLANAFVTQATLNANGGSSVVGAAISGGAVTNTPTVAITQLIASGGNIAATASAS